MDSSDAFQKEQDEVNMDAISTDEDEDPIVPQRRRRIAAVDDEDEDEDENPVVPQPRRHRATVENETRPTVPARPSKRPRLAEDLNDATAGPSSSATPATKPPRASFSTKAPCERCKAANITKCSKTVPCKRCEEAKLECVYVIVPNKTQTRTSCDACYGAKERCSRGSPCTRCERKKLPCVYPVAPTTTVVRWNPEDEPKDPKDGDDGDDDVVIPPEVPVKKRGGRAKGSKNKTPAEREAAGKRKRPSKAKEPESVFLQAFRAAMARYSRQSAVPPLLSSTGERLPANHPEVVAALAERERYWMSRPDHAQPLANHRGFRVASNEQLQDTPESLEDFSKYLAQFDILFSDIERRLWHMTGTQLKALPQLQDAPYETRISKFDAVQWALARPQLHQDIIQSPDTPIPESIPAEAIENASIYWEPEYTNTQLEEIARISREREISELGPRNFPNGANYWFMLFPQIRDMAMERGILGMRRIGSRGFRDSLINMLQIYDARRGIYPVVAPHGFSRFHGMSSAALQNMARQYGTCKDHTKEGLIAFLLEKAPAVTERSEEDTLVIVQSLLEDIADSINPTSNNTRLRKQLSVPQNFQFTWNNGLMANPDAMRRLQTAIGEGLQPAPTSNTGYLCGVRALAAAVAPIRYSLYRNAPAEVQDRGILNFVADDMMELLFSDYNLDDANDPAVQPINGLQGTPTPEYAAYVEELIGALRGLGDHIYDDVYAGLMAMNNLSLDQLSAVLELMFRNGTIDRRYAIGVVTAGRREGLPATAVLHGDWDDNTPIVWLFNDGYETNDGFEGHGPRLSHWEGFELPHASMAGLRRINEWGLSIPDAAAMPAPVFSKVTRDKEAAEDKAAREKALVQDARSGAKRKFANSCLPCQTSKVPNCNVVKQWGAVVEPCDGCVNSGVECKLPEHILSHGGIQMASNITMKDILPWATPMDWEKINQWIDGAKPEAEPTEEHFLVVAAARLSSQGAEDGSDFQRLLNAIPRTAHRYDVALNGGHLLPYEEGRRPTAVMRQFLMAFVRKGTHAIPTALGNRIADPFLIAFVQLMRQVTRVNNPNPPREIHHLVLGIAGFSVDVDNWGSRHKGYFKFLLDADSRNGNNHFEENTYLILVIEDHVINGCPTSIDSSYRSLQWRGYSGKYIAKFKLRSLIDRNHVRNVNAERASRALGVVPWPVHYDPHWDNDARNDHLLGAMQQEWGWRTQQYDGTTVPTDATMHARNTGRNRPW